LTDLSDVKSGIGGLAAENEDIRSHIISFDALMALVESGEAGNSPLLISALQLARRRADFQANASG
jgi:ADP-ribose pyrophosphatase